MRQWLDHEANVILGTIRPQPIAQSSDTTQAPAIAVQPAVPTWHWNVDANAFFGFNYQIYAAWRHVYPGSVRDIAFTASRDGGRMFSAPVRVSDDAWVLEGCPENGPSMTADTRQRVHIAWPTLIQEPASAEPTLALFYAESHDGLLFTPRQRVPTEGVPRHVRIASHPGGAIAMVWEEGSDGTRRVALGLGTPAEGGRLRWQRRIISGAATATYPVLVSVEDGVVAAWVHDTGAGPGIRVERIVTAN